MTGFDSIFAVLLGVGLAASAGLNTFLPLLLLSLAVRFDVVSIPLNESFAWVTSDVAVTVLAIATVVEIVADKFAAVDHVLDAIGTFARPAAGALAAASVFAGHDPAVAAAVGLIVGAPMSFGLHTLKAGTRVASTTTTFGCANPVLSLIEDLASFALTLCALLVPLLVPLMLALIAGAVWVIARKIRKAAAA